MIVHYIDKNNNKSIIDIPKVKKKNNQFEIIKFNSKKEFLQQFISLYETGQRLILFDKNHKPLSDFCKNNHINNFKNIDSLDEDSQILFFTSGTNGFPIGAFKTRRNLESEVKVLKKLILKNINVTKIIVTVPFVHIYGILAGVLLPLRMGNVEVVVKENFLPYEILDEIKDDNTLIITTPVFIKALARLQDNRDLNKSMFISSTGPLDVNDVVCFEKYHNTKVMQLFGSTETGGIAYKMSSSQWWKPLNHVKVSLKDEKLSVISTFISKYIIDRVIKELEIPFVTEDIIELKEGGFEVLGRSNKLIKIAGKRISALTIESLIEEIDGVKNAVVRVVYKKEMLQSEQIVILLESTQEIKKSLIKEKIYSAYGTITIPFKIVYTDEIKVSSMGKKIIFKHQDMEMDQ